VSRPKSDEEEDQSFASPEAAMGKKC